MERVNLVLLLERVNLVLLLERVNLVLLLERVNLVLLLEGLLGRVNLLAHHGHLWIVGVERREGGREEGGGEGRKKG